MRCACSTGAGGGPTSTSPDGGGELGGRGGAPSSEVEGGGGTFSSSIGAELGGGGVCALAASLELCCHLRKDEATRSFVLLDSAALLHRSNNSE